MPWHSHGEVCVVTTGGLWSDVRPGHGRARGRSPEERALSQLVPYHRHRQENQDVHKEPIPSDLAGWHGQRHHG